MSRLFLMVSVVFGLTFQASAQDDPLATARTLFRLGSQAMVEDRVAEGCEHYAQALQIIDTPSLRWNLATCRERLGELVVANEHYRAAARTSDDPTMAARATERSAVLSRQIGSLQITIPSGIHDAEVFLDERQIAPALVGYPTPVDPGTHRIRVRAAGYQDFMQIVQLDEGERLQTEAALEPETRAANAVVPGADREDPELSAPLQLDIRPETIARTRLGALPSEESASESLHRPILRAWWFWTAMSVVVAGAAAGTGIALARNRDNAVLLPGHPVETCSNPAGCE